MKEIENKYKELNKKAWNNKVKTHIDSDFYDMKNFLKGQTSLNSIELELLGEITGKSVLHLQCHFGQDTISLSKMWADATGVDISDVAIDEAVKLAKTMGTNTKFVCSDIYELPNNLEGKFDYVFTSYGTIGWLPDLNKWAKVVSHFLKPDGRFLIVDFHPFVWMYDNDFAKIEYSYFNREAIIENETGTYADPNSEIEQTTVGWNHSTSDLINSLIKNNISIQSFDEYDYSPYNCFKGMIEVEKKKFRLEKFSDKMPMVYALVGRKI